ncbi:P-loop containing nucleoside triphosphate hydrolase protein [Leucogyrophana mollusca]|uniref:P-loop containing nucleoside triphosphate hydrolase protein n=1 Tax=Leucogyrophana mollusca TaxID=85980 RepID=A0ACB8AW22_9AGAM|nr:P-loop containing nucleoside triphosphate hydrolase protein [Leucogyrophana mollusca]
MGSTSQHNRSTVPSLSNIRDKTQTVFGRRPCLWQAKVAQAFLSRDRDILCIAGTGQGKTLSFWMPLLFKENSIQIVVTPLNLLGKQNVESLQKAGISAISIHSETATPQNFRAIENLEYRVVIVSPEQIMKDGGGFEELFKKPLFTSHIMGIIFDEAHCVTSWGEFRPEYKELGRLRFILPHEIPFLVTSATLSSAALQDVKKLLHIRSGNQLVTIHRTTDRPNIKIGVRQIKYPLNSYADLAFLVPDQWEDRHPPPPKFLIFFDDINEAIEAAKYLRERLPPALRDKIKWFNSDMTTDFKNTEIDNFTNGDTWGLCTTESFGMGIDIPDIKLVIQWRATCSLATLWQRFGRAVRERLLEGTAILFAEKDLFDKVRRVREEKKNNKKRKQKTKDAPLPPAKRPATTVPSSPSLPIPPTRNGPEALQDNEYDASDSSDEDVEVVVTPVMSLVFI